MPELILAIDVGTTSVRAAVVSPAGDLAAVAAAPLASRNPLPGRVEQDARAVWNATRRVIAGALAGAARAPADIAAIGITTQRTSAVIWEKQTGAPVSPLVIWSDLRGAGRAAELAQAGFLLAPQQAATKLEGMFADAADAPGALAWGNIDSYLIWRLTGGAVHATDRSQAWPTGYLAFPDLGWNEALIDHQGLDAGAFPALVDTWGEIGLTASSVFGAEVPICADIADQQSALIAHGGQGVGVAKVTYGTSATLDLATGAAFMFPGPMTPPLIVSSVEGDTRYCVEGMVLAAGGALDWLRRVCALGGHAPFEALAASVDDAGGAAFLPALQGLGAPHGDPARRAALTGLSASTSRAHIARAGLEGVAFRVREVFDHLFAAAGVAPPKALCVDGGLTGCRTFLQVQADLLGRPLRPAAVREATLMGAAIGAGRGAGLLAEADVARLVRYGAPVEPAIGADEAEARFAAWRAAVYR